MGPPLKYYVTAFGESVLLAERDEVQRVAEAHEAVDDATRPVVTQ